MGIDAKGGRGVDTGSPDVGNVGVLAKSVARWGAVALALVYSLFPILLSVGIAEIAFRYFNVPLVPVTRLLPLIIPAIVAPPLFLILFLALKKLAETQESLAHANEEMRRLAYTDHLTGLMSRRHFLNAAERELRRTSRHGGALVFLMMDIDRFKSINDRYGHACGDAALQVFAEECGHHFRGEDLVGRMGGEEFAALLVVDGASDIRSVADRLRRSIGERTMASELGDFAMTVSIGIGTLRSGDDTLEALMERADKALYEAKRGGRNKVVMAPGAP